MDQTNVNPTEELNTPLSDALETVERVGGAAERVEATAELVSSGFGAVAFRLEKEKQARLDRCLDVFEDLGEGYAREEAIAHQQFHEVAAEVETAGRLFWEGLTDPDGLWQRMKSKGV